MGPTLAKLAPTAVVAVILGYLSWPEEGKRPADAASKADTLELSPALLKPAIPPTPSRDPFGLPAAATDKGPSEKPATASAGKSPAGQREKPAARPPLSAFALTGTIIRETRRVALLNGQLVAEGEAVKGAGSATALGKLARVEADRVWLQFENETVELKFADRQAPSSPSKGSSPVKQPAGSRRPAPPQQPSPKK